AQEDLRVDIESSWTNEPDSVSIPGQVHYLKAGVQVIPLSFRPDAELATEQERKSGRMTRAINVTLQFREGRKTLRRTGTNTFSVRLNLERVVRRVPPALGNILGMTPKGMR